jgi:hypothetical protein
MKGQPLRPAIPPPFQEARNSVPQSGFEIECDRLSNAVDKALFEQLQWARIEGPMLTRLAELAQSTLEGRPEFELIEEGATKEVKRFVLKVHHNRLVAITFSIAGGKASLAAEPIDRSKYTLSKDSPVSADYQLVDEQWMAEALQELFSRVQSLPEASNAA